MRIRFGGIRAKSALILLGVLVMGALIFRIEGLKWGSKR